jgi:peptidoglycan hydrolase-like amidase
MLALAIAATVRIGVFGLFHPVELEVKPVRGQVLVVDSGIESNQKSGAGANKGSSERRQILEGSASARLRSTAQVTGRDGGEATFVLSVPGLDEHARIQREFHGRLEVLQRDGRLVAIVTMDLETAVASIVAAEGSESVPFEARKAQAVVARSFLTAGRGRHADFDFCDTTHCQFLREPPRNRSAASRAAAETRGQMLTYEGRVIAALYSADCGGHTRTLAEAGWGDGKPGESSADPNFAYPYFGVECPVRSILSGPLSRRRVSGHQVGMCQVGAAEMARRGSSFEEILRHYFPATAIVIADREIAGL